MTNAIGRRTNLFPGLTPAMSPRADRRDAKNKKQSLTALREKLIKIGATVVHHARAVTFQLAEVAVPRELFAAILARIGRLSAAPSPG